MYSYELFHPCATYAPWNTDKEFQQIYKEIKFYTLVDEYRCYELWTLVRQSKKVGGAIIEVGVWRGGTGAIIAKQALNCNIKDKVYLCDTFKGTIKTSIKDPGYRNGEHSDTSFQMVDSLYNNLQLCNATILNGVFPEETSCFIKEDKIRFCHIDVDTYQSAKDVYNWVWNRLSIGGIVIYDDYGFQRCDGITELVEEQLYLLDRIVIYNLNGHAILIKIK